MKISNKYLEYTLKVLIYAIGGIFIALGVSLALRSNLGLSTWDTLHYSLHKLFTNRLFPITIGDATIVVAVTFTITIMYLNRKWKYALMAIPIFYVGELIDIINLDLLADFHPENLFVRILLFASALLALPLGGSLLIISTFPAGVFDEFTLCMMRIFKTKNLVKTRVIIEISAVILAVVLGLIAGIGLGQLSIGTIIFALSVGSILKLYLSIFERIGLYETEQVD